MRLTRNGREKCFMALLLLLFLSIDQYALAFVPTAWHVKGMKQRTLQMIQQSSQEIPESLPKDRPAPKRRSKKTSKKQPKGLNRKARSWERLQNSKRLNQMLVKCQDSSELLQLLQNTNSCLTKQAGGGALNSVNFSTSLHRLARYSTQQQQRTTILADPRFALLVASMAEALTSLNFKSREFSNIGWALAKLKLVPPFSAMPYEPPSDETLLDASKRVRQAVLQAAQERRNTGESARTIWVPALSQLAGHVMDRISTQISDLDGFRMQEYANLLWAWATADRANADTFESVLSQMIQQQRQQLDSNEPLFPQEWSNSIWAFATAQVYNGHEDLICFMAELMETDPTFASRFKPQELSNTVWGIATLLSNKEGALTDQEQEAALAIIRRVSQSLIERASEFKTQELSNTLWALATVGFGLTPTLDQALNNYVVLESDEPQADYELKQQALNAVVSAALPRLHRFRSQELNNLAWALARLVEDKNDAIDDLLEGIGRQLCDQRRPVTSQDIGTTIWSLATLEFFDADIYRRIAARLTPDKAPRFKPQELSNTLWALATAEIEVYDQDAFDISVVPPSERPGVSDPATVAFGIAAKELMRRPHQFKPQEIKDVLWSFSKVGIRHPKLFKAVTEHLVGREEDPIDAARGLDDFSPQGLGNMAWAFARQAQMATEVADRLPGTPNISLNNGRMAVYTASYFDIGEVLLQRLFAAIADTDLRVHDSLSKLKPQDLSNTAWTFAVLGLRHTEFMEAAKSQLVERTRGFVNGERGSMTIFKGQELANLIWALATLNVSVEDEILDELTLYLERMCGGEKGRVSVVGISKIFKRQELANIAWSCAVFNKYPKRLMNLLYTGLVGTDDEHTPAHMAEVYGDNGLQAQAIMSLIYVQAAMDLQGSANGLTLPSNFPDEWKQLVPSIHSDPMTEIAFELNLSTSKIQRAVSSAFDRIGFEHEEEHVITMEEMAVDYGISVPSKRVEILSIDIANVDNRIAIEVDGPAHFINRIDEPTGEGGYVKTIGGKLEYQFEWKGSHQEINGPTALKQRLLSCLGWKIFHLPFWEWYALTDDTEQEKYCKSILETG